MIKRDDYIPSDPADYVDNRVALARYKMHVNQEEFAERMSEKESKITEKNPIRLKRIEAGLSQKELARLLDVSL